ncbi:MAG: tetratricopeptide (TPR) repeat protein [Kiritimatiellia bacterium]|jgi:tetratricopeptide (TPR) repeat protein
MRLLFLLATMVSTSALAAKGETTIAVVGLHQSGLTTEQQSKAIAQIVQAIESRKGFDALDETQVAWAITGREEIVLQEAFLGPGRRLLEDGKILHNQAQPEDAILTLQDAAETLLGGMTSANASRDLWETWVYLGSSHLAVGDEDEAKNAFATAVALNPEREPNPAKLSPLVVQGYAEALRNALKTPGELSVKVTSEAAVFINEREIGTAPAHTAGLAPGQVHVFVRGPDGANSYRAVNVVAGEHTKVELTLGQARLGKPAQSNFARSQQTTNLYKAIGKQCKVDLVLVVGNTEDSKLAMQLYSPIADTFSRPLDLALGDSAAKVAAASVGQLLEVVTSEGNIASIATTPSAAPLDIGSNVLLTQILLAPLPSQAPSTRLKTWQLAAGGAGLLMVGGGLTAGLIAGARGPDHGVIIVGPVP